MPTQPKKHVLNDYGLTWRFLSNGNITIEIGGGPAVNTEKTKAITKAIGETCLKLWETAEGKALIMEALLSDDEKRKLAAEKTLIKKLRIPQKKR